MLIWRMYGMTNYISPYEFETLFHIVSNHAAEVGGERFVFLTDLASKLAARGTSVLHINAGVESEEIEDWKILARHAESDEELKMFLDIIQRQRSEHKLEVAN